MLSLDGLTFDTFPKIADHHGLTDSKTWGHRNGGKLKHSGILVGGGLWAGRVEENQQGGQHHKDQNRRADQAKRDGNGHRDEELRLEGLLQHEGKKAQNRRERCQQNRSQTPSSGRHQRLNRFDTLGLLAVEEFNQNERVVHDDAGKGDEPNQTQER